MSERLVIPELLNVLVCCVFVFSFFAFLDPVFFFLESHLAGPDPFLHHIC